MYTYIYDDALRLKTTQYSLNGGATVTLASNTYDELGRLLTTQHNGQSSLKTTYAYNVRSWLKSSASPLFNQTQYYNDTYAGSTARYNGNISTMSWKMSNESPTRGYKFAYDNLSRLTAADYLEGGSTNDHFNTAYDYDKQGNMTSLSRRGNTGTSTYGNIDVLTMAYAGNQLVKAEDSGTSVSLSSSMDFKNNSNVVKEYGYDANGNLTQDLNKGIKSITYNLLNLPQTLSISNSLGSATNSYTYAADGRKLKAEIGSKTTEYCGNVIYENGALKRILVEGGYIEGGAYYFYLTDHLGNNRVVADASGNIKQTNHYYPFGMSFAEGTVTSSQPYKYNGKELDTDRGLNLYDYSARYMDPALGRFNTVDPKAEKYYSISPYAYCLSNPVKFIDPDGMKVKVSDIYSRQNITYTLNNNEVKFIQFDKDGILNSSLLNQYNGTSDNFVALKTLANSETNYVFAVSDKDGNGKVFFDKTDKNGNFYYGITMIPGAENASSPDNNVYIYTASFLDEKKQVSNTAHEGYGHAFFYELSKKDLSINPNHTKGAVGTGVEYDPEFKVDIPYTIFGNTNLKLEEQIRIVEQQAIENYENRNK